MDYHNSAWRAQMRIRLDVNNALHTVVGQHGIDPRHIADYIPGATAAIADIAANRAQLEKAFLSLA